MEHTPLPHRHGSSESLSRLESCMQEVESFQAVAGLCRLLSDAGRVRIFWLLCHCEECVIDLSALVGMTPPAVSHHLRLLRESGLVTARRAGKEVYYRAAEGEQAQLLHRMIERTMAISCPEESRAAARAPHLPPLDAELNEAGATARQLATIRAVHDFLTQDLASRVTIDELARKFLMNPSTMKALFKSVYGASLASHIREHRMERAAELLRETDESIGEIAAAVGYESQSRFSAEFRKAHGVLPTEYRRARGT